MNEASATRRRRGGWVAAAVVACLLPAASASAGELLTARNGMTLYTFVQDSPGRSACSWYCIRIWPPAGVEDADGSGFGAITREGGGRQLTYAGKPLYYFVGDRKPGDANGAGIDQKWQVVTVAVHYAGARRASRSLASNDASDGASGRP